MKALSYLSPVLLVGGTIFFSLISSIEFNPMSINYENSRVIYTIMPQGWGFFTRDPREPQTLIYARRGNRFELVNKSNAEPEYLFGISRTSRRKNVEFGQIFSQIADSLWIKCPSKRMIECEPPKAVHFKSFYTNPICRGEYLLVMKQPVPWAWSKSNDGIEMPFKVCKIHVD